MADQRIFYVRDYKKMSRDAQKLEADVLRDVKFIGGLQQVGFEPSKSDEVIAYHKKMLRTKRLIHRLRSLIEEAKTQNANKAKPAVIEQHTGQMKTIMEDIEKQITELKTQIRQNCVSAEEEAKVLDSENTAFTLKIDSWMKANKASAPIRSTSARGPIKSTAEQEGFYEISIFDNYVVDNGGHSGGWEAIDHRVFLKHRGIGLEVTLPEAQLIQLVSPHLPTKTDADVWHHELWYREYERLRLAKKEAIAAWKQKRFVDKLGEKEQQDNELVEERKKRQEMEKLREIEREKRREAQRQQVLSWQERREQEKENILRHKQELEIRKLEREKQKEMQRKELEDERVRKIEAYKARREEEIMERERIKRYEREKEMEERRKEIAEASERIHLRNNIQVVEKTRRIRQKAEEDEQRAERLRRAAEKQAAKTVFVDNDAQRITQPTKSWQTRQDTAVELQMEGTKLSKQRRTVQSAREANFIAHAPRLATPSWLK